MSLEKVVIFELDMPERMEDVQERVNRLGSFVVKGKNIESSWRVSCYNVKSSQNGGTDVLKFCLECSTTNTIGYSTELDFQGPRSRLARFNNRPLEIHQFNSTSIKWTDHVFNLKVLFQNRAFYFPDGKLKCKLYIFSHQLDGCIDVTRAEDMDVLELFDHMIQAPANVTLKTDDDFEMKVNKEVLSMASDVFTTMFSTDMIEASDNVVQIKEFAGEVVHELMSFIYCKQVKNDISSIHYDLFKAAHAYNIKDLFNLCIKSIIEHLQYTNVLYTAAFADVYDEKELFAICCDRIYLMWPRISVDKEWIEMKNELKVKIINEIMSRTINSQIEEKTVVLQESFGNNIGRR